LKYELNFFNQSRKHRSAGLSDLGRSRPADGNETVHWLQAERELDAQHGMTGEVDGARGKSVEPPVAGRHAHEISPHSTNYAHPGVTTDSLHHVRN